MSYIYQNVKLVRVIDGDTVELEVDAGFRFTYKDSFRLARINSPEKHDVGGPEAGEYLRLLLSKGIVLLETTKRDKWKRWIAEIYIPAETGRMNVSDAMRIAEHAVPYMDK